MKNLTEKIGTLPPGLQLRVEEFVDSLARSEELKPKSQKKLRQDWAGALKDYREQYTSLELQQETIDHWAE
jgi:Protein of unknown function (DUF2281)